MGKRVWQKPGTSTSAEWDALTDDPLWEINGGVWTWRVEEQAYVVISIQPGSWERGRFHGQARWVDLSLMTLPERQRILGRAASKGAGPYELLLQALRQGWGVPVVGLFKDSPTRLRSDVKKQAKGWKPGPRRMTVPAMHHRLWEALREQDPVGYLAGFLCGMRRGEASQSETRAFLAGWEHGWEYAVGRVPLPRWYTNQEKVG